MPGFKVLKGKSFGNAELDSTWNDLSKANHRRDSLKKSCGKRGNWGNGGFTVWVVPMTDEDPPNYRKPRNHR